MVQVKLLSQQELVFAQEKGVPVIDIRPPVEFEAGHIVGCAAPYDQSPTDSEGAMHAGLDKFSSPSGCFCRSINIPLYRPITGWDFRKFMRRAGFAFFGVFNVSLSGIGPGTPIGCHVYRDMHFSIAETLLAHI